MERSGWWVEGMVTGREGWWVGRWVGGREGEVVVEGGIGHLVGGEESMNMMDSNN